MTDNGKISGIPHKAIKVTIFPHRKSARLSTTEGVEYSLEELREALNNAGVVKGINEEYLKRAASGKKLLPSQPIATSILPQMGEAASLRYLISDKIEPLLREDDRIDFREINLIKNVSEKQPLAIKTPPKIGAPGYLVTGEELPGKMGNDLNIKQFCGKGTRISPKNENAIIAAIKGAYKRAKNGRLSVHELYSVRGDINYATGNIRCAASAIINGDVKSGFEVHVEGDLEVQGLIENAVVDVDGDLSVRYGFTRGTAPVRVAGEIRTMYIYNRSEVKAGCLQASEMVGFSNLNIEGDVTAKRIVGGNTIAQGNIIVQEAGSQQHESRTKLNAGLNLEKKKERDNLKKELEEKIGKLRILTNEYEDLSRWAVEFKKSATKMLNEIARINDTEIAQKVQKDIQHKISRLKEITGEIKEMKKSVAEDEKRLEELAKTLVNPSAKVVVNGTVFAGVSVTIGESGTYKLTQSRYKVQFRLDSNGQIVVENI